MGLRSGVGKLLGTGVRTYSGGSGRSVVIQIGEPEAERRADPGEPQGRRGGVEYDTRRGVWTSARQWPTKSGTVAPGGRLEPYGYVRLHVSTYEPKIEKESGCLEIQSHPRSPTNLQSSRKCNPCLALRSPPQDKRPTFEDNGSDNK